jgi:hypothetical protein
VKESQNKRKSLAERWKDDPVQLIPIDPKDVDCPTCRICHHQHCSWFVDDEGIICDACLIGIPCSMAKGGNEEEDEAHP